MKLLASSLMATALLFASHAAMAQSDHDSHGHSDHGHDRGHDDHGRGHDDRGHDGHGYDHRGHDTVRYDHRDQGHYYAHGRPVHYAPRGHRWERGHRYYGPTYVVSDYRSYRLRPPPRGYHWVRDRGNNDFLLVAVATGIILDIATH